MALVAKRERPAQEGEPRNDGDGGHTTSCHHAAELGGGPGAVRRIGQVVEVAYRQTTASKTPSGQGRRSRASASTTAST
jgi:hypothetical protein